MLVFQTPLVHLVGLEPTRLAALEPKSSVSAIPPQVRVDYRFLRPIAIEAKTARARSGW